jgi:hypothetical protein
LIQLELQDIGIERFSLVAAFPDNPLFPANQLGVEDAPTGWPDPLFPDDIGRRPSASHGESCFTDNRMMRLCLLTPVFATSLLLEVRLWI